MTTTPLSGIVVPIPTLFDGRGRLDDEANARHIDWLITQGVHGIFALGTIASDFTLASIFLLSPENQTIPAGLATMEVALDELLGVAGINVMAIPVVLICAIFARDYVRGLTASMVEGS